MSGKIRHKLYHDLNKPLGDFQYSCSIVIHLMIDCFSIRTIVVYKSFFELGALDYLVLYR